MEPHRSKFLRFHYWCPVHFLDHFFRRTGHVYNTWIYIWKMYEQSGKLQQKDELVAMRLTDPSRFVFYKTYSTNRFSVFYSCSCPEGHWKICKLWGEYKSYMQLKPPRLWHPIPLHVSVDPQGDTGGEWNTDIVSTLPTTSMVSKGWYKHN